MRDRGPKYQPNDTVRIWIVEGRPVGTVERIINPEGPGTLFRVRYDLPYNGLSYLGDFSGDDLTLAEKAWHYDCNCLTASGRHMTWCNVASRKK